MLQEEPEGGPSVRDVGQPGLRVVVLAVREGVDVPKGGVEEARPGEALTPVVGGVLPGAEGEHLPLRHEGVAGDQGEWRLPVVVLGASDRRELEGVLGRMLLVWAAGAAHRDRLVTALGKAGDVLGSALPGAVQQIRAIPNIVAVTLDGPHLAGDLLGANLLELRPVGDQPDLLADAVLQVLGVQRMGSFRA